MTMPLTEADLSGAPEWGWPEVEYDALGQPVDIHPPGWGERQAQRAPLPVPSHPDLYSKGCRCKQCFDVARAQRAYQRRVMARAY